jgi:hypothetical protein
MKTQRDIALAVRMLKASIELEKDLITLASHDIFVLDEDIEAQCVITVNILNALLDITQDH